MISEHPGESFWRRERAVKPPVRPHAHRPPVRGASPTLPGPRRTDRQGEEASQSCRACAPARQGLPRPGRDTAPPHAGSSGPADSPAPMLLVQEPPASDTTPPPPAPLGLQLADGRPAGTQASVTTPADSSDGSLHMFICMCVSGYKS